MKKRYVHWEIGSKCIALLLLILIPMLTVAQTVTVSGQVTDLEDGTELIGVTIVEKGTLNGTTTDFNGNYRISAESGATLVFSFVGYRAEEITVGNQSVIDVQLELDIEELQEIIIVGYGAVEKKDMTGVVATIDQEKFNKGAITNPAELLAGKAAGVSITTTGQVGGAPQVRIRGTSSINASSDPLYVIDGVIIDNRNTPPGQRNPLNFINTEDIENITVLKDASAAAIYGSRGAKGVIIITTRKGKEGEPRISYDGYYSVSRFVDEADILNASDFTQLVNAKFSNLSEDLGTSSTDWVDQVTQTATGVKHALSFSNGSENSSVYISLMHQTLNGVVRRDKIERNVFSLNYDESFFEESVKLSISTKNSFVRNNFGDNQIGAAFDFNPTVPVRDTASMFGGYFEPRAVGELGVQNPVARQDLSKNVGRSFRSLSKVELTYNVPFVEGLSWTNNVAYDITNSKNRFFQKKDLFGVFGRGSITFDEAIKTSVLYETYGNYKKDFDDHSFDVTAGYSYQTFGSEQTKINGDSLITDIFGINDLSVAKVIKPDPSDIEEIIQRSYFGRVNYSYMDRYLLTVNFRYDGSSQFGPDNRFGFFPSVALAWRVYDEPFAAFLQGPFDDLKLRVGYGVLGNQEFDPFLFETFYFLGTNDARYQFGNEYLNILRPVAVDPDIKWEVAKTLNVGVDYTFRGGRLYGSLEYYQRDTEDLLFDIIIPAGINVGDRVLTNIGEMKNNGVELELTGIVIDNTDLNWELSFNASHNINEVTRIDNSKLGGIEAIETGGISGDVGQNIQIIAVGEALNTFSVYEHKMANGLPVPDEGFATLIDMYVDQNEDGKINEDDRVPFNNANPDVELGLTSNASFRGFSLAMTLRAKLGNYVYNNVASSKGYFNRISEFGPNNIHNSALETRFNNKQLFSDYYIEDGSFLKLDNITLSYSFNQLSFAKIRVYGTAQNVLTLSGYSGLDPEISNGIDNNLYPRAITLIGGINVTF